MAKDIVGAPWGIVYVRARTFTFKSVKILEELEV